MDIELKKKIHAACIENLEAKVSDLKKELEAVRESAIAETKSSMGDKYETGREMMMQERTRLGKQLDLLTDQLTTLDAIDPEKSFEEVKHGCLVLTDKSMFFLSSALGQIDYEGNSVFVISGNAPIAKTMEGKKVGDSFTFNGITQKIEDIA